MGTIDDYWSWLENDFVGNIRAQPWYNGQAPRNLSGFLDDKTNRLIGWAVVRQRRVKAESCARSSSCRHDLRWANEDRRSFAPGWQPSPSTSTHSDAIRRAFEYRSASASSGYVYELRGRLSDLRSNLTGLRRLRWLDGHTRRVSVHFTLYNPNVELFTSASLVTEFDPTGGLLSSARFDPLSFRGESTCALRPFTCACRQCSRRCRNCCARWRTWCSWST